MRLTRRHLRGVILEEMGAGDIRDLDVAERVKVIGSLLKPLGRTTHTDPWFSAMYPTAYQRLFAEILGKSLADIKIMILRAMPSFVNVWVSEADQFKAYRVDSFNDLVDGIFVSSKGQESVFLKLFTDVKHPSDLPHIPVGYSPDEALRAGRLELGMIGNRPAIMTRTKTATTGQNIVTQILWV